MNIKNPESQYKKEFAEASRLWIRLINIINKVIESESIIEKIRIDEEFNSISLPRTENIAVSLEAVKLVTTPLKSTANVETLKPYIIKSIDLKNNVEVDLIDTHTISIMLVHEPNPESPSAEIILPQKVNEVTITIPRNIVDDLALIEEMGKGEIQLSLLDLAFKLRPISNFKLSSFISWEGTTLIPFNCQNPYSGIEYSLVMIFLELYRSLARNPKSLDPIIISRHEDLVLFQSINEGVFLFTCTYLKNLSYREDQLRYLREQLNKLMGYRFKFIIIPNELIARLEEQEPPRLYNISARVLEVVEYSPEKLCLIVSAITGFIEDHRRCSVHPLRGNLVALARTNISRLLDESLNIALSKWPWKLRTSIKEAESYSHFALKAAILVHLIENLKIDPSYILVEDEIGSDLCSGNIPDIYIKSESGNIVIDAKSGIGMLPVIEVEKAFNKYISSCHNAKEIWIVVRPFTFILYTKPLLSILRRAKNKYENKNLELLMPAYIDNKYTLLNTTEFLYKLKELAGRI